MLKVIRSASVLLACLLLCACGNKAVIETSIITDADRFKTAEDIKSMFDYTCKDHIWQYVENDRTAELLENNFNEVKDISIERNGNSIKLYEYKYANGFYVIVDGESFKLVQPDCYQMEDSAALYKKADKTDFAVMYSKVYTGGKGVVSLVNREFGIMGIDRHYEPFSCMSAGVKAESENLPIKAIVFTKDGLPNKIDLITVSKDNKGLTEKNIEQVKALLDELGFDSENGSVAVEYAKSLDGNSVNKEVEGFKVMYSSNVNEVKGYKFNVFSVEKK